MLLLRALSHLNLELNGNEHHILNCVNRMVLLIVVKSVSDVCNFGDYAEMFLAIEEHDSNDAVDLDLFFQGIVDIGFDLFFAHLKHCNFIFGVVSFYDQGSNSFIYEIVRSNVKVFSADN
jgi:hypothetical protein